ncbi:MAG: IS1380 family transposase [Chlamydiae bacterium]|nr:IS1380 family transposase [Chlamydiota bacterium]MBI3265680.1 IS1380 family transposase [Chlamydiota bacterium]
MTECIQQAFEFQGLKKRKVTGQFDGGTITSDGGSLLLRELEKKTQIMKQFSQGFIDHRDPDLIEHSVYELVTQRVYGICLGYEDLNDHDVLRKDPVLAVLSMKEDPTGAKRRRESDRGNALVGKSTLNRLELTREQIDKTKKIVYQKDAIERLFVESYMKLEGKEPEEMVLDLDATDDLIYGMQEGRFFHGYYGDYCYLPLYIFCGDHLLSARLRPSDRDASDGSKEEVERIMGQIREKWKNVKIILRGDSGFAREEIMGWCDLNGVEYVFGLAKNERLKRELDDAMNEAMEEHQQTMKPSRRFVDFQYRTLDSWSRERRVIGKAEYLEKGENPRFVVTSLAQGWMDAKGLYEDFYCERGNMENRIKEQQLYLFADRTSAHSMRANQLRLWFSSIAYVVMNALRTLGLHGTQLAQAQCHTIRNKILKIGAQVRVSFRRIWISFASGYPYQNIFYQIFARIRALSFSG